MRIYEDDLQLSRFSLQHFYLIILLWRLKFKRIVRCCYKISSSYTETVPGLMCKTDCEKLKFQSQLCPLMTCLSIIHHVFPMELFCYITSSQHPSISRHSEMRTKHQQHPRRNHVQDNPLNTLSLLWKVFLNISLKKTS